MVLTESEVMSQGEVESPLQSDLQSKNNHHHSSSLGRQSSIYSLTLDEFQNTLCDSGKHFGSMNMDEFLTSIWNAEENQTTTADDQTNENSSQAFNDGEGRISKQPSLPRQGSLSLPPPLCLKTVDEVWSEISRVQQQQGQGESSGGGGGAGGVNVQNPDSAPRQPTFGFGEMTLEDFLIKAGVVKDQCTTTTARAAPAHQQYGLYHGSNNGVPAVGPSFASRPIMGMTAGGGGGGTYQTMPQGAAAIGESAGRSGGYAPPAAAVPAGGGGYGGRAGNGGGLVGPVSPVSSEGLVNDNVGNQFGMDMSGLRGRKRIIDGPVEKVVERRQRRMIKNRESAARSRARKQAYTVELEAELNQLKDENKQLKHALAELERKRKQQYFEEVRMRAQTKAQKANEKLRMLKRNLSCPL